LKSYTFISTGSLPSAADALLRIVGEKNVALAVAALAAIAVLAASGGGLDRLRATLGEAVTEAGSIILVIGAGGALG